jgi:hypothetical protein
MSRVSVIETHLVFTKPLKTRQKTCRFTLHWPGHLPPGFVLDKVTAAWIHGIHISERGWSGIGYHYLIHPNGDIERGRPRWAVGAHDEGENSDSLGVCVVYTDRPTEAALSSLAGLLADLSDIYGQLPDTPGTVDGHRDNEPPETPTECPGDVLYAMLPEIRRRARGALGY